MTSSIRQARKTVVHREPPGYLNVGDRLPA
jgi:hypothetical protein